MSRLDDALKRFEQVSTLGMRDSDYRQASDSLAWLREDLAVVKTALSKKDELLGLYKTLEEWVEEYTTCDSNLFHTKQRINDNISALREKIEHKKQEIEKMK